MVFILFFFTLFNLDFWFFPYLDTSITIAIFFFNISILIIQNQWNNWGEVHLPLNFLHGSISYNNRFEQAADRYAMSGAGWWPYA